MKDIATDIFVTAVVLTLLVYLSPLLLVAAVIVGYRAAFADRKFSEGDPIG